METAGGLTVTPLLVTLFVDAAVDRAIASGGIDQLPVNIPEIYLAYLERLNPTDPATPNRIDHGVMRSGTMSLAQTSLGRDLVPADFRRQDAENQLIKAGLKPAGALVDRLVANGVIDERSVAGLGMLRFQLDPVAEYLAAIAACHELGSSTGAWQQAIARLAAMPGYPEVIRGYLTALSVCRTSYEVPLRLAHVELPWAKSATEA